MPLNLTKRNDIATRNLLESLLCLRHPDSKSYRGHPAFRIFVDKPVWSQVLSGLAEETDYDNFKSEVARHQGKAGAAYEHSLHEVWSVMHRLQR